MKHEKPFERADLKQFHWEKGVFPRPSQVLDASLKKIEPDGSVLRFDEDLDNWYSEKPYTSVPLEELAKVEYDRHLLSLAQSIERTMIEISLDPSRADRHLRIFAIHLTAYRHSRKFLSDAASLIRITDRGGLISPQLTEDIKHQKEAAGQD